MAAITTPGRASSPVPTIRETLRYVLRLARLVRGHWRAFSEGLALSVVIGAVSMAAPYASKLLIDNAYPARDVGFMHVIVIGVLVLTVSTAWMGALQGYFAQIVSRRVGAATALMFFNHVQHLRALFFDSHQVGEVMSRFTDVRGGLVTVTGAFHTVVTSAVSLVLVPPFLLLLNWKLALLSVLVVPITTAITTASSRYVRRYYKLNAEATAALSAYQFEVFSHIRSLKTMGLEAQVYRRVARETHGVLATSLRAARVQQVVTFVNGTVRAAGTGVFTWYAWSLIFRGDLTLGAFVAFAAYLAYLTGPVSRLAALFGSLQQAAVTLGRMFEYLDLPVEQDPTACYDGPPAVHMRPRGDIVFRGVGFVYEAAGPARAALADVDLTLPRESMTAIVGPSGGGKSTLLRLIPRLIEPTSGVVTLGGTDLRAIPLPDLRRQIAMVWQEPFVMRGTILDNLLIGNPDASRERVLDALDACQLAALVAQLPEGLETPIAEWGATLSGGQRQRLSIARALIREAPLLLLDEAMANIDAETEDAVLANLRTRYADRTIVLVTHRPAAAARADKVCVIEEGRVVGTGPAIEIAQSDGSYARPFASSGRGLGVGRVHAL